MPQEYTSPVQAARSPRQEPGEGDPARAPREEDRRVIGGRLLAGVLPEGFEDRGDDVLGRGIEEHLDDPRQPLDPELLAGRGGTFGDAVGVEQQCAARRDLRMADPVGRVRRDAQHAAGRAEAVDRVPRQDERRRMARVDVVEPARPVELAVDERDESEDRVERRDVVQPLDGGVDLELPRRSHAQARRRPRASSAAGRPCPEASAIIGLSRPQRAGSHRRRRRPRRPQTRTGRRDRTPRTPGADRAAGCAGSPAPGRGRPSIRPRARAAGPRDGHLEKELDSASEGRAKAQERQPFIATARSQTAAGEWVFPECGLFGKEDLVLGAGKAAAFCREAVRRTRPGGPASGLEAGEERGLDAALGPQAFEGRSSASRNMSAG